MGRSVSDCPTHLRPPGRPRAALAQLVEQLSCKQQVVGSSPTSGSIHRPQPSGARSLLSRPHPRPGHERATGRGHVGDRSRRGVLRPPRCRHLPLLPPPVPADARPAGRQAIPRRRPPGRARPGRAVAGAGRERPHRLPQQGEDGGGRDHRPPHPGNPRWRRVRRRPAHLPAARAGHRGGPAGAGRPHHRAGPAPLRRAHAPRRAQVRPRDRLARRRPHGALRPALPPLPGAAARRRAGSAPAPAPAGGGRRQHPERPPGRHRGARGDRPDRRGPPPHAPEPAITGAQWPGRPARRARRAAPLPTHPFLLPDQHGRGRGALRHRPQLGRAGRAGPGVGPVLRRRRLRPGPGGSRPAGAGGGGLGVGH